MRWRLWWWRKVRRADIAPDLRERFEFYGERLMTLAIESHDPNRIGAELSDLGQNKRTEIIAWLQERRDLTVQQEDRSRNRRMGAPDVCLRQCCARDLPFLDRT